eukprot:5100954-Pyramimonas_sp.AAC.1
MPHLPTICLAMYSWDLSACATCSRKTDAPLASIARDCPDACTVLVDVIHNKDSRRVMRHKDCER